jgi:hypothetical protein
LPLSRRTYDEYSTAIPYAEIVIVEARAAADLMYRAGVEAARRYKWRVLGQGIYSDGIPAGSIVLQDWQD